MESHLHTLGGSRTASPYGPQEIAAERKLERKRKQHLQLYYQKIIGAVKDADRIFIFGPGAAKSELEKELKKSKELAVKIAAVAPAEKMTQTQMAAKAKDFFGVKK